MLTGCGLWQPSSRRKQEADQPDALPQNGLLQWQHPERQAQPSSQMLEREQVQQQSQAQPQADWDHLRRPVRLLRLRPRGAEPPQLWPADGTHDHAAETGDGTALSLRESEQSVACSTCSDDASSADSSKGRGSQHSAASWPKAGKMGSGVKSTKSVKAARTVWHPACLKISPSPPLQGGGMFCQLLAQWAQAVTQRCSGNPLIRDREPSSQFSQLTLQEGIA